MPIRGRAEIDKEVEQIRGQLSKLTAIAVDNVGGPGCDDGGLDNIDLTNSITIQTSQKP